MGRRKKVRRRGNEKEARTTTDTSSTSSVTDGDNSNMAATPSNSKPTITSTPVPQQTYQSAMDQLNQQFPLSQGANMFQPNVNLINVVANLSQQLESVVNKLSKLDTIDQKLTSMSDLLSKMDNRVTAVEQEIRTLNICVADVETSVKAMSGFVDDAQKRSSQVERDMKELRGEIRGLQREKTKISEEILDCQSRSMRDNLLFFGITEAEEEDCMQQVLQFCEDKLKIENARQSVKIDRAHRLGPKRPSSRRPIVAKFTFYQQREQVRKNAYKLKDTHFGISEQFPREIQERRKRLMPMFHEAKRAGKRVHLVRDKLYIDGRLVTAPTGADDASR